MGQGQSTRKITVVNDEVSGVIKISDAVVQRLKGEIAGEATSSSAAPPQPPTVPAPAPVPAPISDPEPVATVTEPVQVVIPPPVEDPVPPPPPETIIPPPPQVVIPEPEVFVPPQVAAPIVEEVLSPPVVEIPPPVAEITPLPVIEVPAPVVETPPLPVIEVPPPPPLVEAAPPEVDIALPPAVEVPPPVVEPPVMVESALLVEDITQSVPAEDIPPPIHVVEAPPPPPPVVEAPPAPAPVVWHRPIIQYIEEPSLSALRVRTEKEEELKKLEDYWKERLQRQEEAHVAQAKLTESEIAARASQIQSLFKPATTRDLCRDGRDAVKECYTANPGSTLLCREKVLEFSKCVNKARESVLTSSG